MPSMFCDFVATPRRRRSSSHPSPYTPRSSSPRSFRESASSPLAQTPHANTVQSPLAHHGTSVDLRRELVTVESGHVVVAIDDEDADEVPQLPDEFGALHHGAQRLAIMRPYHPACSTRTKVNDLAPRIVAPRVFYNHSRTSSGRFIMEHRGLQ